MSEQELSDLGKCFLKYEQTCIAYNELLKENRKLEQRLVMMEQMLQHDGPRYPM